MAGIEDGNRKIGNRLFSIIELNIHRPMIQQIRASINRHRTSIKVSMVNLFTNSSSSSFRPIESDLLAQILNTSN
jgi:hypothetical protein